ncbi:hypothetical protein CAY35_08890 [Pseudoglutamicibacter cumminsii]|uniref:Uncharacterized protein n=1 Tax=Pseudoglutamicibacter cumminsii TaxID=156979 RepID=A0ABX5L3J7_9MICC|nr:hypothetical protein CAY35_08890 [Pseudoglutamicibacter cumminsii]
MCAAVDAARSRYPVGDTVLTTLEGLKQLGEIQPVVDHQTGFKQRWSGRGVGIFPYPLFTFSSV